MDDRLLNLENELKFLAVRSGGKGGQNVNKVSTKIELYLDVNNSTVLTEEEKLLIISKLKTRVSSDGILRIVSQTERSQLQNKIIAKKKFFDLLAQAFKKEKKRRKTNPSKASKITRLKVKKIISEKKSLRIKKIDFD